ncbi:MAG: DivIVA domain-containing protein [Lactobacillales bacterium]|jgi:cell division initiation protein|nr:DivIVA domain-containing protein [Lactobacillales bacterium]
MKIRLDSKKIVSKNFKTVLRGYDSREVDEFLDDIADDYDLMAIISKENIEKEETIRELTLELEKYREMEAVLTDSIVVAQQQAEYFKKSKEQEMEVFISQKKLEAEKILLNAENQAHLTTIATEKECYEKTKLANDKAQKALLKSNSLKKIERDTCTELVTYLEQQVEVIRRNFDCGGV